MSSPSIATTWWPSWNATALYTGASWTQDPIGVAGGSNVLEVKIDTACIDPGKPWQNGSNESFNGKFRDECLSMEWLRNRIDAKIVIENWRRRYNRSAPTPLLGTSHRHSSRGSRHRPARGGASSNYIL